MKFRCLIALLPLFTLGIELKAQVVGNASGHKIAQAIYTNQYQTAYRGSRLYYFNFNGKQRVQRELIAVKPQAKGVPQISLQLDSVLYHTGPYPGLAVARALLTRRQGSIFNSRDFRIQDLVLARQSYYFHGLSVTSLVAGRKCESCYVIPRFNNRRAWQLWVDLATGIVLRADEYSSGNQLLSIMVFEQKGLQIGSKTNFSNLPGWWKPSGQTLDYGTISQGEVAFGAKSLLPSLLPNGYMLQKIALRKPVVPKATYLSITYTDGIDALIVVNELLGKNEGGFGTSNTPIVNRYTSGSMVQLWTKVDGYMVMVMGRLSDDLIPTTFESIFK